MVQLPDKPPASRYFETSRYGFLLVHNDRIATADPLGAGGVVSESVELVLAPRQLTFDEPLATAITFTQGGGKYIESRGNIIKNVRISGTTGYLPVPKPGAQRQSTSVSEKSSNKGLVNTTPEAEVSRAERSGFEAFHQLRQLFRTFGHERRLGNDVTLNWYCTKTDDYWEIEPKTFSLTRTSKSPMSYSYDIVFACIEPTSADVAKPNTGNPILDLVMQGVSKNNLPSWLPSEKKIGGGSPVALDLKALVGHLPSSLLSKLSKIGASESPILQTVDRFRAQIQNGAEALKLLSGDVKLTAQAVFHAMGQIVQLVDDVGTAVRSTYAVPKVLLKQLEDAVAGAFQAKGDFEFWSNADLGIREEWNAFLLEVRVLNDHMMASTGVRDTEYSARMSREIQSYGDSSINGFSADVIPETGLPFRTNPFLGIVGLERVVDLQQFQATNGYQAMLVLSGETIFDVAWRLLGNANRFPELVILNDLNPPFIVADPGSKPPGTLAWGEFIKVPLRVDDANQPGTDAFPPTVVYGGPVTMAGSDVQVISSPDIPWRQDQWVGYTIRFSKGDADAPRLIVANTADTLYVNRPWSILPAVDDLFSLTLEVFKLRRPPSPEEAAYGRDILLSFTHLPGNVSTSPLATALFSANGDFATVAGRENLIQALRILVATPRGYHPFHTEYGMSLPIGRPFTAEAAPLYTFFARQSLLQDPRIASVKNPLLSYEAGALSFQVGILPVNAHRVEQVDLMV